MPRAVSRSQKWECCVPCSVLAVVVTGAVVVTEAVLVTGTVVLTGVDVITGADEDRATCFFGAWPVSCVLVGSLGCAVACGLYALPAGGGDTAVVAARNDGEFARASPTVVPDAATTASAADPASTTPGLWCRRGRAATNLADLGATTR